MQNDEERRHYHNLATPLRKFSNISPRPEFRHFKPVHDVSSLEMGLAVAVSFVYSCFRLLYFRYFLIIFREIIVKIFVLLADAFKLIFIIFSTVKHLDF